MSTLSTTNLKNASSGSNNIVLGTDGSTTIPTLSATTITGTTIQGTIKSGTAVASTSGVAIDFTGLPSWVKRVTVMFDGVSTSGTSNWLVQLGDSGGIESLNYVSYSALLGASSVNGGAGFTAGFGLSTAAAAATINGQISLSLLNSNTWTMQGMVARGDVGNGILACGSKALSATLDRIRVTTVNGTDTFDAGSINILWEG